MQMKLGNRTTGRQPYALLGNTDTDGREKDLLDQRRELIENEDAMS